MWSPISTRMLMQWDEVNGVGRKSEEVSGDDVGRLVAQ